VGPRDAAPQEADAVYTGEIRRADKDGSEIRGFLIDRLGTRIELRGTKDARRGHGYFLLGRVVLPPHLRVDLIDGAGR
jgi:hypothetical protein